MMFKEQLPGFPLHILDDNYPPKLYTSADSYYKIFIRGIPFFSIILKKKIYDFIERIYQTSLIHYNFK